MGGRRHKHDGCSWSVSNENPISKRGACGVYGGEEEEKEKKKQTKRGPKNCLAKTRKASQILRARGETMIFNYQLFCSQFQTRAKEMKKRKKKKGRGGKEGACRGRSHRGRLEEEIKRTRQRTDVIIPFILSHRRTHLFFVGFLS